MAHLGTLHDFSFEDRADDIRGASLYGSNNEKVGKIDDVIFDHSTGDLKYVVVDAGGWLSSKKFMVPANRIRPRNEKEDEYVADLSKKQIETFPTYDEENLKDEKRWGEYEREYRRASGFEETGGVLHQAGSTNILVPDSLPAEGRIPAAAIPKPVTGYKSPIPHREVGLMDTTPIGVGRNADAERLTFVPDAIGADRGDIQDKEVGSSAGQPDSNAAGESSRQQARPIIHRGDDMPETGESSLAEETTIEGDAIFNNEDIAGRTHKRGNVWDADEPGYETVGGTETRTSQGRLPNYPDASQGQRWARFEENLRRQRPKIVSRCGVCDELQNKRREDVA
jgi:sporulation protein YlmC with PRC-barrel domain